MPMTYIATELKLSPGRYRVCGTSDEDRSIFKELCKCVGGHPSTATAEKCPEASAALDKIFPDRMKDPRTSRSAIMGMLRGGAPPGLKDEAILNTPVTLNTLIGMLETCGVLRIEAPIAAPTSPLEIVRGGR